VIAAICILSTAAGLVSCAPKTQEPPPDNTAPQAAPAPEAAPAPAAEPTPTPTPAPEEESLIGFYPLKVGNMWEYEGEGMEYASFIQKVIYSSGNRHQVTIDNGGTVIAVVTEEREDSIVNTYRSGEAYNNENLLGEPGNMNVILLQTPLEKGNFWISEENHYEIVDTEADVVVPAGEFKDCIAVKVTFKDQTSNITYYYKRGVGMVQSEFRTSVGDLITSKLKRYELK
jgi:hypothetical protein